MAKRIFGGVCTALVTPFRGGKVDFTAMGKLIRRQIDAQIDALCILGTTGEAPTLSYDEKSAIMEFSIAVTNGEIPLVFGIGGNNPTEIIKLGKFVKSCGGAAVMVSTPYYNKCTQDGAVALFNDIANAVKLPMIVYNVPGRTGINLLPETLAEICKNKYVCGIKEASGDMNQIASVVRLCKAVKREVAIYCGDDGLALPCYAIGCDGIISVASNTYPRETRTIWINRNNDMGRNLFLNSLPLYKALFCEVNPIPVKYALYLQNLCTPDMRSPLTRLTDRSIIEHGFRQLFKPIGD